MIKYLVVFILFCSTHEGKSRTINYPESDTLTFEKGHNEIWGDYTSVIWKKVNVGGIKEISVKKDSIDIIVYKSFLMHIPKVLNIDSTFENALTSIFSNTPKEAFMDVWTYGDDEWISLADHGNGWKFFVPQSDIWGGGYTKSDFFTPRDENDVLLYSAHNKANAFLVNTYISGKNKIVMYMGVENKYNHKMSDSEMIKKFVLVDKFAANIIPTDTVIGNEKYKILNFKSPEGYVEYTLLGRSAGEKWKYFFVVYFGPEEKKKLSLTIDGIIRKSQF